MSDDLAIMRKNSAELRAKEVLGVDLNSIENPITVLASPAWRGVEGDIWRAASDDGSTIIKHYHSDTDFYVDQSAAISAATEAGKLDIGPKVLGSWDEEGMIAFSELAAPWVAGGLHHAINADIRTNVIENKKAFQTGAALKKTANIFSEINVLYAITTAENITTHNDIIPFVEFIGEAGKKIRSGGQDNRPCHRDGNTANLMVHPDKSVQLIDFDLAANCDPFEDVGAFLVEFFENDLDARGGFEEWHGSFDEGLFQRSMLYGLADDLRWGLIGSILGARSPRTSLEFTKYAAWRFLRLEAHAKTSDANDRIRLAA